MKQFSIRAVAYNKDEQSLVNKHKVVRIPQIVLAPKFPKKQIGQIGVLLLKWSKSRIVSIIVDAAEGDKK